MYSLYLHIYYYMRVIKTGIDIIILLIRFCSSVWTCLLTTIDVSLKYDSGIGGFLEDPHEVYEDKDGWIVLRFFYDNIFNILLIIVMLNIVAGIIIDTFGSLREELAEY